MSVTNRFNCLSHWELISLGKRNDLKMKKAAPKNPRSSGKPDAELGKRIRLRRVEQCISQAGLGDQLGVSFQQVQKYEKGVSGPLGCNRSPPRSMCP
jgi:DNA-binding transcriptional regulator YiaG